jgi:hypothetical protein
VINSWAGRKTVNKHQVEITGASGLLKIKIKKKLKPD